MDMANIDTVLFDLDGTLLDTLGDLAGSLNYTMRQLGLPQKTESEIRDAIGSGIRNALRRIFPREPGESELDEAQAIFKEHYAVHNADLTKPYPGVMELLEKLARDRFRLAVISNKPDSATRQLVGAFFSDYIDVAVGEKPGVPIKPAPDAVMAALAMLRGADAGAACDGGIHAEAVAAPNEGMAGACTGAADACAEAETVAAAGAAPSAAAAFAAPNEGMAGACAGAAGACGAAASAVYVGDSEVDIATAKNAGLPCILASWGFRGRAALIAAGADPAQIADTAGEMLELIKSAPAAPAATSPARGTA